MSGWLSFFAYPSSCRKSGTLGEGSERRTLLLWCGVRSWLRGRNFGKWSGDFDGSLS